MKILRLTVQGNKSALINIERVVSIREVDDSSDECKINFENEGAAILVQYKINDILDAIASSQAIVDLDKFIENQEKIRIMRND